MKKNNRKNCGRKEMDWIDKKSQIQLMVKNSDIHKLAPDMKNQDAEKYVTKLLQDNLSNFIETLIAN